MEVYITRVKGLSLWNQSQYMQSMVAEIGYELGFREMGIYRYNGDNESEQSLSSRIDGIIAGINPGDIIICQFPTGNGLRFEGKLMGCIKAYQGRVAIFIHDFKELIYEEGRSSLRDIINVYNQAEVLIVPSFQMRQLLVKNGIWECTKFVVQEMWDYKVRLRFTDVPKYGKKIHLIGKNDFEGLDPDRSFGRLVQHCLNNNE